MQILKLATNTILYFDSMDYPLDTAILDEVQRFIRHRLDSKTTWTVAVQNVEKQKNSDDCSVFVCMVCSSFHHVIARISIVHGACILPHTLHSSL